MMGCSRIRVAGCTPFSHIPTEGGAYFHWGMGGKLGQLALWLLILSRFVKAFTYQFTSTGNP